MSGSSSSQPAPIPGIGRAPVDHWALPKSEPQGAWGQKRRMAGVLRTLVEQCVTTRAEEDRMRDAVHLLERASELLSGGKSKTFLDNFFDGSYDANPEYFADHNAMLGLSNPIAPPVELTADGQRAIGTVTFATPYEGAPGFVHGGYVAAAFDQIMGYVPILAGLPCLTGSLTIRYRAPTPVRRPLRFEAWMRGVDGRKVTVDAHLLAEGQPVATAEAVFIQLDPETLVRMFSKNLAPNRNEPAAQPA